MRPGGRPGAPDGTAGVTVAPTRGPVPAEDRSDPAMAETDTSAVPPAPATPEPGNGKWWTLVAVCLGTFMLLLDITIVNVALPDIQTALGASFSDLQWVVDAYALTLAALLLTAGSLADMYGRRRLYVIGLLVFTAASLLCGLRRHHADAAAVPRPAGRRRRDHVLGVAGAAGQRVPGQGPRRRVRRLGRDHRPGRGDRPAARRRR